MAIIQQSIKFEQLEVKLLISNVGAGTIDKHWGKGRDLTYISMIKSYGLSGSITPTENEILENGRKMFNGKDQEFIEPTEAIDIYIYCNSEDNEDSKTWGNLILTSEV